MMTLQTFNFLLLLGLFGTGNVYGQPADAFEPFNVADYPKDKYQIKLDTATFSKFKIEIRQVKLLDVNTRTPSDFYCRGWLTIVQGNKTIRQFYFRQIEPVGGCSGLFIPDKQPRSDYFIISKFGDYDGRIIIVDTSGMVTQKTGGIFYISKDNRYLFSNYDSDEAGLTIYDLNKRRLLFSFPEDTIENYPGDWYYQDRKYMARVYENNENDERQIIKIAWYDFNTNKLIITQADKNYLRKENRLAVYNSTNNCNCGR